MLIVSWCWEVKMKRYSLNTAGGLLSFVGTVSLLSGTFSSAWADMACTNANISGSYAYSQEGTGVFPDGQAGVAWMERSLRSAIQVPPAGRNDDQDHL